MIYYDLKEALPDHTEARRILCDIGHFSDSECSEIGSSSTINKVVDVLIKKKMENPDKMITNNQVSNAKQGNTVIINKKSRTSRHRTCRAQIQSDLVESSWSLTNQLIMSKLSTNVRYSKKEV